MSLDNDIYIFGYIMDADQLMSKVIMKKVFYLRVNLKMFKTTALEKSI